MRTYLITVLLLLSSVLTTFSAGSPPAQKRQKNPAPDATATITGRVMVKDTTPMANGVVLLFNDASGPPPSQDRYWRVPDYIVATDQNGTFTASVEPGTYYLQAAQKRADGKIGPPKEHEFFYFHGDAQGNARPVKITAGKKLDLGPLTGGFIFDPAMFKRGEGITAIEGVVTDQDKTPVPGALVFAHLRNTSVGRPVFISERTDENGRYELRVHEGTYYLSVRSVIGGGAPKFGEFQNVTKEFQPRGVTIAKGEKLKGIDLVVARFTGKGSTGMPEVEKVWMNLKDLQTQ